MMVASRIRVVRLFLGASGPLAKTMAAEDCFHPSSSGFVADKLPGERAFERHHC